MIQTILQKEFLRRLDNIKQWQERDTLKTESVSQHSYKVTIFARVILEDLFGNSENDLEITKFKLGVVTHAAMHDWDESLILRDMSHTTKYNSFNGEELRKCLNDLTKYLSNESFSDSVSEFDKDHPDASDMIIENINNPNQTVKTLVKLCDWLALKFYASREVGLGNTTFTASLQYVDEKLKDSAVAAACQLKITFPNNKINYEIFNSI